VPIKLILSPVKHHVVDPTWNITNLSLVYFLSSQAIYGSMRGPGGDCGVQPAIGTPKIEFYYLISCMQ
jgi:hypothetical protein